MTCWLHLLAVCHYCSVARLKVTWSLSEIATVNEETVQNVV
jgi:hypothetical protein